MALKTLNANDKAAFQQAGYNVTPTFEHLCCLAADKFQAETGTAIDWSKWIKLGITVISAILALVGGNAPAAATKKAVGCCDHCSCICCQIKLTEELYCKQVQYMCDCYDESCHCG